MVLLWVIMQIRVIFASIPGVVLSKAVLWFTKEMIDVDFKLIGFLQDISKSEYLVIG